MSKMKYWAVALLLSALFFGGCNSDDGPAISVIGGQEQSVWADEEVADKIRFTSASSWNVSVSDAASAGLKADWLWLEQNGAEVVSGASGEQELQVVLSSNWSGQERKATIAVKCGGDKIEYTITQSNKTKAGRKLKAIQSIFTHLYNSDGSHKEAMELRFVYDGRCRVIGWYNPEVGLSRVNYTYSKDQIIKNTDPPFVYSLDQQGQVISGLYEADGVLRIQEDFVYKDGYISEFYYCFDQPKIEDTVYELKYKWSEGNLEWNSYDMVTSSGRYDFPRSYEYTTELNQYNLDLTSFIGNYNDLDKISIFGVTGKRSKNLLGSIIYYMGEFQTQCYFRYEFDTDGYVSKVYSKLGREERLLYEIAY